MGTKSKITGIIFNILSFACIVIAMLPSNWSTGDSAGGGPTAGFAFWVYSVIFALISMVAYTVGSLRKLKVGGSILQLLFSIGMLLLCVFVGATLDGTCMIVWNVAFATNLVLQIYWLKK